METSKPQTLSNPCMGSPHQPLGHMSPDARHGILRGEQTLTEISSGLQEGAKGSKKLPECVLEVPSLHEVELSRGKQDLPDFTRPGSAAGEPIMKERALLQVSAGSQPFLSSFRKSRLISRILHRNLTVLGKRVIGCLQDGVLTG